MYLGHPLVIYAKALLGFGLCLPGPVAVQVKIIVIGASAGPGLIMFPGITQGIGRKALHLVIEADISFPAIGIEAGIYDHDGIFEPFLCLGIVLIRQLIKGTHGGFSRHGFVAVDVIAEPYDDRAVIIAVAFPAGKLQVLFPDGLQAVKVFRGGDDGHHQRAAFVGGAVLLELHVGRLGCHSLKILQHAIVRGKVAA